jgi:hypothetical protein
LVVCLALAVLAVGAVVVIDRLWVPDSPPAGLAQIPPSPPLPPALRSSTIVGRVVVRHSAIREALEAQVPRTFSGRQDKPILQLLTSADVDWSFNRGPLEVADRSGELNIAAGIDGMLHIKGAVSAAADGLVGTIGGLIDRGLGQGLEQLSGMLVDQNVEFRGSVSATSHPVLTRDWRIEPNLASRVSIAESSLLIVGVPLELGNLLQPMLADSLQQQTAEFQSWLGNNPFLEQAVRGEWANMCRSIGLSTDGSGLPPLWLEVRPTRAFASQPRIESAGVVLDLGVEAETRVTTAETKPDCPFPERLDIVPPAERSRITVAAPIDIPLADVSKLLEAQLRDKTFPEERGGPLAITIRRAALSSYGERLLLSLRVKGQEKESQFGLGAEANVYVWGRPVLDLDQQILRLTDIKLDVESKAAFGLLAKAAESALPALQESLARNAAVDLKPLMARAKKEIAAAVANFSRQERGVRVDAAINDIRLVSVAFDANTLRVTAEIDGSVDATISSMTF